MFILITLLSLLYSLVNYLRTKSMMKKMDFMLDCAIRGEFDANQFDETELSKMEVKLSRFLSTSKLKKVQIQNEQAHIHTLISDISHQTKTPITNILLYSQILCEQNLPTEAIEPAKQVINSAEKLNFLIQSMVKTSRLESGIIKVSVQKSDVNKLIVSVLDSCIQKAQTKQITLSLTPFPTVTYAFFDLKWCEEALYNILDNAIKYTNYGGQVTLSVKPYELFLRIDVKDTGIGIKEEDLAHIFKRFWRADPKSEGVGIGLYLSQEIISACGGYIKVSSIKGVGSTFSIFLVQ